jgi:hypothetical protein
VVAYAAEYVLCVIDAHKVVVCCSGKTAEIACFIGACTVVL